MMKITHKRQPRLGVIEHWMMGPEVSLLSITLEDAKTYEMKTYLVLVGPAY